MRMQRLLIEVLVPEGAVKDVVEKSLADGAAAVFDYSDVYTLRDAGVVEFTVAEWAQLKAVKP